MKNIKTIKLLTLLLALVSIVIVSCNKDFEEPPHDNYDPNLITNIDIKSLKDSLYATGTTDKDRVISQDWIISGVVVSSDYTGNFYKELHIQQDSTAGIKILVDDYNLSNDYPVGRKIYVKLKGLTLSRDAGMYTISRARSTSGLEGVKKADKDVYLIKATLNNTVYVKTLTIGQINTTMQSMPIRILNAEVVVTDTAKTFADAVYQGTVNIKINECASSSFIELRNSGYSKFAGYPLPNGNGTIDAIVTFYNASKQLIINSASDLKMDSIRCDGSGAPVGTTLWEEKFESLVTTGSPDIVMTNWFNIGLIGNQKYKASTFSSNKFAKITAYNTAQAEVESWLVTPEFNLDNQTGEKLTFKTLDGYNNGATLTVWYTTNWTGDVSTSTWTQFSGAIIASGTTSGYAASFTNSGILDLSTITGNIRVAFKYNGQDPSGSGSDKTSIYEIDDVRIYN
jgi:hypothetical protein